jgi:hypothetical protein
MAVVLTHTLFVLRGSPVTLGQGLMDPTRWTDPTECPPCQTVDNRLRLPRATASIGRV